MGFKFYMDSIYNPFNNIIFCMEGDKMTKLQEFDLDWIDLYIEKLIEESIWYEI